MIALLDKLLKNEERYRALLKNVETQQFGRLLGKMRRRSSVVPAAVAPPCPVRFVWK